MSSPTLFAGQNPNAAFAVSSRSSTIRWSSATASSWRSRAAWPTVGSSRIAGYAPRSSHVAKNGVQSIRPTRSSSGWASIVRTPRNAGRGGRTAPGPVQSIRSGGAAPRRSGGGPRAPAVLPVRARTFAYSSRIPAANASRSLAIDERRRDADRPRRVDHVDDRGVVARLDLHRGVRPRRRRPADQQRDLEALPFHLGGDERHLLERRRDQPRQADQVGVPLAGRLEDLRRGHHHAEVADLVVVALQDDPDDVLADVVDVALHGRHDDAPGRPRRARLLLGLDERHEMGDGLLHDPGALHDLRQEHLARAEQVADDVHPGHQRALDDLDGSGRAEPGLLRVLDDERVDALDERVGQALLDRPLAPGQRVPAGRPLLRADAVRDREQPLRGVGPPVRARRPRRAPAAPGRCRRRSPAGRR